MVKLIGIAGKKYSGKDTVGKFLGDMYGFKRFAFADPLKEVCKTIFGFTEEQVNGNLKEVVDEYWMISPRRGMQYVGTDLFRDRIAGCDGLEWVGSDLWVNVLKRKILEEWKEDENKLIVITDVRYDNEAAIVKELGGVVVKILRFDDVNGYGHDQHQSEIGVSSVDVEIENNGTLDELYEKCRMIMEELE